MADHTGITRRDFLGKTAGLALGAVGFPYIVQPSALGKAGTVAPSERITVGCVGVGPQGTYVMQNFLAQKDAHVMAICDLKQPRRDEVSGIINRHYGNTDCAIHIDFREIIARDDIDVILAAPNDHWHVLVALEAARAGKDIYLEKPMGLSLAEDQVLRDTCHQYGTIFQFGTQQRSDRNFRLACELVRNRRIGTLKEINVWCSGSSSGGSRQPAVPPDWIDYNMWQGPAPWHPYTPDRVSNQWWWFISDYALGFIAGWGVHPLDIALWGLGDEIPGPVEIEGKGVWPDPNGVCNTAMNWDIAMRLGSGVTMNYTAQPASAKWQERYKKVIDHGTAFEGTDGWVHVSRAGINSYPENLVTTDFGRDEIRLPESSNHARNLLDCVRTRKETMCPIDTAVQADILCHISDIAIRLEQKLRWDPVAERFIGNDAANRRLVRAMRSPWRL